MSKLSTSIRCFATLIVALAVLTGAASVARAERADDLLKKLNDSLATAYAGPTDSHPRDAFPFALMAHPTVNDYLKLAEQRNPDLRAAFYKWRAAIKKTGYAGALPDPLFTYGYMVADNGAGLQWREQQLSLMQEFPWFGTLGTRKAVASEAAQMAYREYESKRLEVLYNVRDVLYDYWYLGQQVQLTRDNLELLKFWESVARTRYQVALTTHPDVIKAQVELGKLDDRLTSLSDQQSHTIDRLSALLDVDPGTDLPIPDSIPQLEDEFDEGALLSEIVRENPNIQMLQHRVRQAEATRRLAGKTTLPKFRVGVEHTINRDGAGSMSTADPWMASVGITLPIWFGKNRAVKDEARAMEHTARYSLESARDNLSAYVSQVLFKYDDALRRKKLYRDGLVPKAEQSLNATYAAYQSGDADFLSVLDAQRQLLEFQLQLDRSTANVAINRAEIEMLLGRELKDSDRE